MTIKCPKCQHNSPETSTFCADCGTKLISSKNVSVTKTLETSTNELNRGTTFAKRYEIIKELGKGGMGRVYKAHDTEINEEVALKLLKPEIATDKDTIKRFRNELKIARKVSHKNVCRMYDIGRENSKYFITMEYVPGEDLRSFLRRKGRLSPDEAIRIAREICEGLAEAHRLGVVHRDLKPQNIMIDHEGQAKIMDFGIARSVEAPGVTQSGVIIGTPDYISPEQAEGETADQRSDIYSLGVILYEMVTGHVPFKGDTAFSVAMKHKTQLPKNPKKLNPQLSDDLARLILVCMEKDRERRYQTAEALLADLQNIEEGFPLGTKIRPRRSNLATTFIRRKAFIPASIAVIAVMAILIWQFLLPKVGVSENPAETSIAVLPFDNISPEPGEVDWFVQGIREDVSERLMKVSTLIVRPPETVSRIYTESDKDLRESASKLRVGSLLMGKVQVIGNRFRLNVSLIDAKGETNLWQDTYDGDYTTGPDIFDTQSDVAERIASSLGTKPTTDELMLIKKRPTQNMQAWNLYRLGRFHESKNTPESLHEAVSLYNQAIEEDPGFGHPYAGIASAYLLLGQAERWTTEEYVSRITSAAEQALEIDSTLAEPYRILGVVKYMTWDFMGADKDFQTALRLNPNEPMVHIMFAQFLNYVDRHEEAISHALKAREIDPVNSFIAANISGRYYFARRLDEALAELHKALELDSQHWVAHWGLGKSYSLIGQFDKAIGELKQAIKLGKGYFDPFFDLGFTYARAGMQSEAEEVLSQMTKLAENEHVAPSYFAYIYTGLGDKDLAFKWLEKAYQEQDQFLVSVLADPMLDSLRSDPRFDALEQKIGLTEYMEARNIKSEKNRK